MLNALILAIFIKLHNKQLFSDIYYDNAYRNLQKFSKH